MLRPPRSNTLVAALAVLATSLLPLAAAPGLLEAPNVSAAPANQLAVAGNACGPTSLLNAFRMGNSSWQAVASGLPGESDKQRITTIIRQYGMRPSGHLPGRPRWSRKGVNIADLSDIANEMTAGKYLPHLTHEVLFRGSRESPEELLRRTHRRLETSLRKGFPPLLSLRRYALRKQEGKPADWVVLDAHFVTLVSLPAKLEKGARSFPVTYIDPWGGKRCQGAIALPQRGLLSAGPASSPCTEALFPQASVGRKLVKPDEPTALALAATLGRF